MPSRPPLNIQDGQLFQLLRGQTRVIFELMTGVSFGGYVLRFDRYCILAKQQNGAGRLVYKHALSCIGMMAEARPHTSRTSSPRPEPSSRVSAGRGRR